MAEHRVTLTWRRTTPDFDYRTYSRDHTATFKEQARVNVSAAPAYRGNPQLADPEDLLVAALSSCHMLSFLAIASNRKFVVNSYDDDAVGFLEKNDEGKLVITRTVLRPRVTFEPGHEPDAATYHAMHHKAHEECFIANSVKTEVTVEAHEPQHA